MTHPRLACAIDAAEKAGRILMDYFRQGVAARPKERASSENRRAASCSYNLVTDADLESERAILDHLRSAFPDDAICSEETARAPATAERVWVVDPLDGTNNFAHGIDHFAISVAYVENGVAQCGVVHNPACGDWFTAVRGAGARHNGQTITVSSATRLDACLVGLGFYYDRGAMMHATLAAMADFFGRSIHGVRRMGTASLDLCYVAMGRFDVFFEYRLAPWDYAAGTLIVEEAGGRVTDARGGPLRWTGHSILASNGRLHEAACRIVAAHHPPEGDPDGAGAA